jgi:ribonuclease BN (tRNA processing enzyme)
VRAADRALIVMDAGRGARDLGASLAHGTDTSPIALFLTHQHLDHVIGLPQLASFIAPHRQLVLRCGNADAKDARKLADTLLSPPLYPVIDGVMDALVLEDFDETVPIPVGEACLVTRLAARHPGGAAILRVSDAQGLAFAFAPDNELSYATSDPDILAWRALLAASLHRVPILVHDSMYSEAELPHHEGWGHSTPEEATRFALECEAGMLVLWHHHPDRHDDTIDSSVEACRSIVAAHESQLRVLAAWEGLNLYV